jgi:hypothetical protein
MELEWPFDRAIRTGIHEALGYKERMAAIAEDVQAWLDFLEK